MPSTPSAATGVRAAREVSASSRSLPPHPTLIPADGTNDGADAFVRHPAVINRLFAS
ncbi:hypothetical protein QQY66_35940 [Streptomyces sp. DG2A-72]|uniref:hypothetical protein n=1 Tax=Streptomyces sp. DG2A-72 TaxID=3051386 RepID=UPI00265C3F19|nr:hypothetical protein [Streptomyces sp. DG2A-72]MDO0936847.1 hypothetical protein [Streptomyces sp. DG2A-72]